VPVEPEIYLRAFKDHPEFFGSTLGTMGDFVNEALHSDPAAALNTNFQGALRARRGRARAGGRLTFCVRV
jgi:hypothetical protein